MPREPVGLTCGDFGDQFRRVVAALHNGPRPVGEVPAALGPEQVRFNPLPGARSRREGQIHTSLRRAFART